MASSGMAERELFALGKGARKKPTALTEPS
jgi:hypothetical protein